MKSKVNQRLETLAQPVPEVVKPIPRKGKTGWLKLAGWAKEDALYDEAMKLGANWRRTS